MAEEGNQSSIQDGSDAYIIIACSPCSEDGAREEATKYCQECDEYLCSTCTKYHNKMKATRAHKLVDKEEGRQELPDVEPTVKFKCHQHQDRDIEMFCGTHDMVYCLMCIATDHRSCCDVTSLKDASRANFKHEDIQRLKAESKLLKERLVASEKKKQANIVFVEEKRESIQKRVTKVENDVIQHIRTLSKQANCTLNETCIIVKNDLESDVDKLRRRISELENINVQLETKAATNQEQQFVQVKICEQKINEAKDVNTKCEPDSQISVDFAENTKLGRQIFEVKTLGNIDTSRATVKRKITRQKEINVRMPNDTQKCRIMDMCQIDSGACILTDAYNNKIKLLDINHNATAFLTYVHEPTGICKTGCNNDEDAATLSNRKIEMLAVSNRFFIKRNINLNQNKQYSGVAYCARKFWLTTGSGVDVYDSNGRLVQSVAKDSKGQRVFELTPQQMVAYRDMVFVADYGGSIVCLASDGRIKAKLQNNALRNATGMCISNDGTIYAIDERSKKIVMFNQEGKCLGVLVPDISSERMPMSLCYDVKKNCLLIGYLSSDSLTVCFLSK